MSIMDRQLLRQKISVIKTNTFDDIEKIVHFGISFHIPKIWTIQT